jgi:hypothetical protein
MAILIENTLNEIQVAGGLNTNKPAVFGGLVTFNSQLIGNGLVVDAHPITAAINSTATATAAQIATGYITSTSGSATTITLPTGTLLGGYLGAAQGYTFAFYVDNTAGANTVTMAVATNGILSALAVANSASFGLLTVPSGVTGLAQFTIMFSSATAYVWSRTA